MVLLPPIEQQISDVGMDRRVSFTRIGRPLVLV